MSRVVAGVVVLVLGAAALGVWWFSRAAEPASDPAAVDPSAEPAAEAEAPAADPSPAAPASAQQPALDEAEPTADRADASAPVTAPELSAPATDPADPGRHPATTTDPRIRSVLEARRSGAHPERLSLAHPPTPFDREAYLADPEAWLHVIEPGRAMVTAERGIGAPRIEAAGSIAHEVARGESTILAVRAPAGMPVSWLCLDGGVLHDLAGGGGLNSITVAADAQGVARVRWQPDPRMHGVTEVICSSPVCLGRETFVMTVIEADDLAAVDAAGDDSAGVEQP